MSMYRYLRRGGSPRASPHPAAPAAATEPRNRRRVTVRIMGAALPTVRKWGEIGYYLGRPAARREAVYCVTWGTEGSRPRRLGAMGISPRTAGRAVVPAPRLMPI